MATLTAETSIRNTETKQTLAVRANVVQTNAFEDAGQLNVLVSETTLTFSSSLTNPGMFVLINRDPDNYVDIGIATGVYILRLLPGESVQGRLIPSATALFLLANTAPVRLQYTIYDA